MRSAVRRGSASATLVSPTVRFPSGNRLSVFSHVFAHAVDFALTFFASALAVSSLVHPSALCDSSMMRSLRNCRSTGRLILPSLLTPSPSPSAWRPSLRPLALWSCGLALLLALLPRVATQENPVNDFCRRFFHQSAVVDDRLYLDGGLVNWNPISNFPSNYSNPYLLYNDLSTVADSRMPQLYANLSKNASIPSVSGGALWADDVNKWLYLFGGESYQAPLTPFTLYAYDIINNQWADFGSPSGILALSFGASVAVPSRGEAYYYGGWMSNASVPNWGATPPDATANLVKYDMDTNQWQNYTGPDRIPRAEGVMVYIPASDGGMLVSFGGVQDTYGNGTYTAHNMSAIILYDVLSGKWYEQTATGDVPPNRRRFCAGVSWPPDQSSYNIYLYGGASVGPGPGFDDVYILSLPSFTWIKMYPVPSSSSFYPHYGLSCNVVRSAQMLVIGGTFPLSDHCDSPDQWGEHNLDLGEQNANKAPWQLFEPNKTTYAVPSLVLSAIGGDPSGGATLTAPIHGYGDSDLIALMTRKADVPQRTPTRSVSSLNASASALSTGAIVGIAVGGAAILGAILLGCCCLLRRRRKSKGKYAAAPVAMYQPPGTASLSSPYSDQSIAFHHAMPHSQPHSPFGSPTSPFHAGPFELNVPAMQNPIEMAHNETTGQAKQYHQWGDRTPASESPTYARSSLAIPDRDPTTPTSIGHDYPPLGTMLGHGLQEQQNMPSDVDITPPGMTPHGMAHHDFYHAT